MSEFQRTVNDKKESRIIEFFSEHTRTYNNNTSKNAF